MSLSPSYMARVSYSLVAQSINIYRVRYISIIISPPVDPAYTMLII